MLALCAHFPNEFLRVCKPVMVIVSASIISSFRKSKVLPLVILVDLFVTNNLVGSAIQNKPQF